MKRLVHLLSSAQGNAANKAAARRNMLDVVRHRGRGWGLLAQYEEARLTSTR